MVGEKVVGEKVAEERMAGEKICIKVILPLKLGWEPCYYAPEEVRRGDRVSVRFSGRQYVGVVSEVRVRPQTDASRIKEIDCVEQELARVREEELRLWSFMAEYYLCTVGEVYKAAYPLGKLAEERAAVRAARRHEEIAERRRAEAKARSERMEVRLKERLSKKQAALAKARKDSVKEALRDDISKIDRELRAVQAFLSTGYAEQNATASQTQAHDSELTSKEASEGELEDEMKGTLGRELRDEAGGAPERGLKDEPKGMSERAPKEMPEREPKVAPGWEPAGAPGRDAAGGNGSRRVVLTPAQEKAKREIEEGLAEGKPVLLNGVAGSGKTEIYIQLAQETLSRGKNVLYLSPEIALSGQLEERLREVFGSTLICFHSALTPAKRQEAAARVREGGQIILGTHSVLTPAKRQEAVARVREGDQIILDTPSALPTEKRQETAARVRGSGYIVLGTRSALFLPHHDLGLIVVDEEHDSSYKQDSPAPRYQGRDTAVMTGTIHGAGVLLGSATPSMESLHNCATGRYRMVELSERYFAGSDARLVVIDTLAERRKRGMVGNFSRKLIEEMKKALAEGGQVALLRSRRAYSPLVQCEECGDIPKCVHCNVSLSYHRASARLLCHHCGYSVPYTGVCGKCGGPLKALGTGTQKIEEEVRELFPEARVARLDADSDVGSVVTDFKERRTDILVGTQVLTKGFDFEGLSLVAVLLADSITGQQDFRSDERALQTFSQFRGRCSRRGRPGTFVVQTSQPDHPVYSLLRGSGESPEIMQRMLDERRDFGYPPFTRLVRIVLKDRSEPRLENLSLKLAGTLVTTLGIPANHPSFQLAGPFSPPVDKISDEYIRHIRIHLPRDRSLSRRKETIASAVRDFETEHSWQGHVSIDVDPL